MSAPLEGVLVIDFTRAVAGPFCTMMLGDLGARVIKVEPPDGDETRAWGPPFVAGESSYYLSMNRNKEGVVLDLKSERGRRAAEAMTARADLVVENFRSGVADRLGIGYEQVAARNPRVVYGSISAFGDGPWRERAGYDVIIQAMSGLLHTSAGPDQRFAKTAFPVADIVTSLFTGQAMLAALYDRERTGRGRRIEVSLFDGMLCAMSNLAANWLIGGTEPARPGVAQGNIVPYQLFDTADRPIIAGALNQDQWRRFCTALGKPEWMEDARFRTNADRCANRAAMAGLIGELFATAPASHWLEALDRFELPCGPVLTLRQALEIPQSPPRYCDAEHPTAGKIRMIGHPARVSGHQPPAAPPPRFNEHGEKILKEFLLDD